MYLDGPDRRSRRRGRGLKLSRYVLAQLLGPVALLTVLLVFVPFIPGLRDIPRWIPIHKLIWRRYYASLRKQR